MQVLARFVGVILMCVACSGSAVRGGAGIGGAGIGGAGIGGAGIGGAGIGGASIGGASIGGAGIGGAGIGGAGPAESAGAVAGGSGVTSLGGSGPTTMSSNVFVDQIVQGSVDKVDLLFMIDNSPSMADKQQILKAAVSVLLRRLTVPNCVNEKGVATGATVRADGTCAGVATPELAPLSDIHLGIVSSSLGAHGGTVSQRMMQTATSTMAPASLPACAAVCPAGTTADFWRGIPVRRTRLRARATRRT